MKLTQEKAHEVVYQLIGEEIFPLVDFLLENKNVSEFQISAKIKFPVDVIRNQLYQLYNHNLITFNRKKDKQKGWYIYYWTLNNERILYLVHDLKRRRVQTLNERLKRETDSHFFGCSNKCIRVDFEQATDFEFKCPECGELLNQEDNTQLVEKIQNEIKDLEKQIEIHDKKQAELQESEDKSKKIIKKKVIKKKPKKTK